MRRREHETDAGLFDAAGDLLRREVQVDAEGFERVRAAALAGGGPVAMFGDMGAGAGGHERRRGGHVEELGRAAAAGAAGIDEVGRRDRHLGGAMAHGFRRAGDFLGGFAMHPQCHQHGADLRRRGVAGHDGIKHLPRLGAAQAAAGDQALKGFVD